jgi:hypothetical protein
MRILVLCLIASLELQTAAQTKKPAPKPAAPAPAKPVSADAKPAHFSAANLNNEDDLLRIYSGDFQSVRLDRAGTEFMLIISSYMNDYARDCKQFLPPNKVEITQQVCAGSTTSSTYSPDGVHDVYGNLIQPSGCTSYQTVGTGLYADPELYAAEQDVDAQAAKKLLGNMLGMFTGKGGPQQITDQLTAVGTEMETLIRTNACGSPGLKNFQSNLIRFANSDSPVKYAGAVTSGPAPAQPDAPVKEANFARLLDDLVADNARGWMMNRYQPGSITDPIVSRDPLGHPVRVIAQYSFTGMQGTQRGRVTVSFKDGAPDCLYFSDNPDTCRLPAAGVVSNYEKNMYAK